MGNIRLMLAAVACFALPDMKLRADVIDPEIKRDILAGWAELERHDNSRTAIDAHWERHELEGPNKGNKSGMTRYRRNGEAARISSVSEKTDDVVRNSKYIFSVTREPDTHPWTMRFVELDLASNNAKELQDAAFLTQTVAPTSAVLLGSFVVQQRKPSSLSDDPKFKMTKIERLPDGLIKLHYQYDRLVGEFDCDPTANYVIRRGRSRHQFQTKKGSSQEYVMTHERHFGPVGADGRVSVERFVSEVVNNPGGRHKRETTYSYPDVRNTGELDEERFRLTAYGLPEPEGIVWEKPRRWLPYWLAGAGVLIILVTTWWLRKKRRARPGEKQL